MKNKKRVVLFTSLMGLSLFLAGCGRTGMVTSDSTGFWDRYVIYYFGEAIKLLSFKDTSFGNYAFGIILFTIIIRVMLMPLMHYQNKSMRKTQELQPQLNALKEKYSSKDPETKEKLMEEQQKLYAENNVSTAAGCLPLLVQMPIMIALWQSISRTPGLNEGKFLWMSLGEPDPIFILPILAAAFTLLNSVLTNMAQLEKNATTTTMTYVMPAMILFMGTQLASGLSLYWVVSNSFQVLQTLLINNPFKIRNERAAEAQKQKELDRALKKALGGKKPRNKK